MQDDRCFDDEMTKRLNETSRIKIIYCEIVEYWKRERKIHKTIWKSRNQLSEATNGQLIESWRSVQMCDL